MRFAAAWLPILILLGAPAWSHHSVYGVYEPERDTVLEGTVREFRYVNPHPVLVIDVRGEDGTAESWALEMDNRGELARIGFSAGSFAPGQRVLVRGSRALSGDRSLYLWRLDRPADGFWYEQRGSTPFTGVSKP